MIQMVICFQNDMVMVFDAAGEQIPEYQGCYEDVRKSILRDAPSDAVFAYWFGNATESHAVSKEEW